MLWPVSGILSVTLRIPVARSLIVIALTGDFAPLRLACLSFRCFFLGGHDRPGFYILRRLGRPCIWR